MTRRELTNALEGGLTVEELIEELQTMDPKAKVVFEYVSSDYWRTPIARVVESVDEGLQAGWSDYHQLPCVLKEEGSDEDDPAVVVLNLVLK